MLGNLHVYVNLQEGITDIDIYIYISLSLSIYLVGGFNPSEKYLSMGRVIPYIMEKKMFQTTNQIYIGMVWFCWDGTKIARIWIFWCDLTGM